jgi:cytochrome P450 family 4
MNRIFNPVRFLFPVLMDSLPIESTKRFHVEIDRFTSLMQDVIDKRRSEGISEGTDLLSMMLNSQDHGQMTDHELRCNLFLFFLAGHDTTAGTLSFAIGCLALYPDIQQKVYDEIKRTFGDKPITNFEDIQKLEYTANFLKEVMRLYPAAPAIQRNTAHDDTFTVEGHEYHIPKESIISVSIYGLHHSDKLWKDASKLNPDRYHDEGKQYHYAWSGFGGGPRMCIGNNFSMLEQKMFIAELVRNFEIEALPGQKEIEIPSFGLLYAKNLHVCYKLRT